ARTVPGAACPCTIIWLIAGPAGAPAATGTPVNAALLVVLVAPEPFITAPTNMVPLGAMFRRPAPMPLPPEVLLSTQLFGLLGVGPPWSATAVPTAVEVA